MKPITPARIKRFTWWWRDTDEFDLLPNGQTRKNDNVLSVVWKDHNERAAYAHELVIRLHRDKHLPTYGELTAEQRWALRTAIPGYPPYFVSRESTDSYYDQLKTPRHTGGVQWNLAASNSALENAFKRFIHEERIRKGMFSTKAARLPIKNTVSWRWLEVWDEHEVDGRPLGKSESSMLSRAKKRANEFAPAVLLIAERKKSSEENRQ